jgi:pyrroloquinoline quinone biosynthesis protein E
MNGWGQRYLTVNPVGDVLPCPTAAAIPGLVPDNVRDRSVGDIWRDSAAFNQFRGTDWMPEPCHSCDLRDVDFGGCRCQAALLTGDPAVADPACSLSPHRDTLTAVVDDVQELVTVAPYQYRSNPM